MKLVEILARELEKWPKPDREHGRIESMSQDGDLQVSHYTGLNQKWADEGSVWGGSVRDGYVPCSRFEVAELASDHATAIVTREMWQAERERIANPGKKANASSWIRHRGGKCPVEAGMMADVRNRAGDISTGRVDCTSVSWHWSHDKHPGDIMAYRIHKPAEQSVDDCEPDPSQQSEPVVINLRDPHPENPLAWRDRISEIDRTVEELEEERVSLIQRLEGEGFRLIDQVNEKIAGAARAHEDMSDWRNWKVGDLVECVNDDFEESGHKKGKILTVSELERLTYKSHLPVCCEPEGPHGSWPDIANIRWKSRPSA